MRRTMMSVILAGSVLLAACGDATAPGNANDDDRAEILALLGETGWFDEGFGIDGAADNASFAVSGFNLGLTASAAGAMDTVPLTQRWGRRFLAPTERNREVNVSGDTATVTWSVRFADGQFLLDRTRDEQVNPTTKPMDVTSTTTATLVRRAEQDSAGRRWALIALSPARLVNTATDRRTVAITQVVVRVNGEVVKTINDVNRREDLAGLVDLSIGDEVSVTASVTNTTANGNTPETFVFLHLYHASLSARGWARIPMEDNGDGTWTRSWIARHDGHQRQMVDAIDSQTFSTDTDDDYRSEVWGVPYQIRRQGQ